MATRLGTGAPRYPVEPTTSFWAYGSRLVRHPRRAWTQLLGDPARLRYGFFAVLCVAVGYAVTVGCITLSGGTPSTPWIAIPRDQYFKWETFFIAPVTLVCWILAAGVMHLLSKLFHGKGTFDDTLALLGYAVALPTLISLIPDLIRGVLTVAGFMDRQAWEAAVAKPGTPDWLFLWSYMLAYMAGLLCLFPVVAATVQRLRRGPAVVVGLAGAVVYQGLYLLFIR